MRFSELLIPTLRESPSDAETVSHKLMIRAGMIRKVAAGIYTYLPLGLRVIKKVEQIVREEMNAAGAQEVLLPIIMPRELWEESGRWGIYGKELLRVKDRNDRDFCVGPTHEEAITDLVRNTVKSYKELPKNLYQIQTKFRDEVRPRFGLMRGREFIMKDAYSFDVDEAASKVSYKKMFDAYNKIFKRCGLGFRPVEAFTGVIGGSESHEFQVLAESGEDEILSCGACEYAANIDKAAVKSPPPYFPPPSRERIKGEGEMGFKKIKKVSTPNMRTVEDVSKFLNVQPSDLVKTLLYETDNGVVAALIRGDHELSEGKLAGVAGATMLNMADAGVIQKITSGPLGFSGPVGLKGVRIIADHAIAAMRDFVVGANEKDVHYINTNLSRDFTADIFADLRKARAGDTCPACQKGELKSYRGIEVGQVFYLGTKYSKPMKAVYLDEGGKERDMVMGCYGIGIGRTAAAAIEQNNDEKGIIWPAAIAPFAVEILPLNMNDQDVAKTAEMIYKVIADNKIDVVIDDRDLSAGIKFNDADLIGIPYCVVIGARSLKEGKVEIKERVSGKTEAVKVEEIISKIKGAFPNSSPPHPSLSLEGRGAGRG